MFFRLLITFFGYISVCRMYKKENEKGILSGNLLKKWFFVTVIATFFVFFEFFGSDFAYWTSFFSSLLFLQVTIFVTRTYRESKFRCEFLNFMDRVVLQMQTGRSFRASLLSANESTTDFFKPKLEKIIENVFFGRNLQKMNKNDLISEILEEFSIIDQAPHRSLQRVLAFRRQLKIEEEIRRKSGQKQRQIQVQSCILSLLYVCTLAFLYFQFDWRKNIAIILISLGFFLTGTVVAYKIGRRNLWKA